MISRSKSNEGKRDFFEMNLKGLFCIRRETRCETEACEVLKTRLRRKRCFSCFIFFFCFLENNIFLAFLFLFFFLIPRWCFISLFFYYFCFHLKIFTHQRRFARVYDESANSHLKLSCSPGLEYFFAPFFFFFCDFVNVPNCFFFLLFFDTLGQSNSND